MTDLRVSRASGQRNCPRKNDAIHSPVPRPRLRYSSFGRALRGVDLTDLAAVSAALQAYEGPRKPHTARQVQQAWMLGKVFHHTPALLRPLRDLVFDHTPFLQMVAGDTNPKEINKQLALIED